MNRTGRHLPPPLLLAAAAALLATGAGARALPAEDCLACHADASLTMERRGRTVSLQVRPEALARSSHAGLDCTDCHAGFDAGEIPHRKRIEPVDCAGCHGDAPEKHPFHPAMAAADGGGPGLSCRDCHGTHDVAALGGPDSPFAPGRLAGSCGACHGDVAAAWAASEHGRALAEGQPGAPDCLGCHRQPLTPGRWNGDRAKLKLAEEKVCLSCHLDDPEVRGRMGPQAGFIAAYERSVHGAALLAGNAEAANCVDCHGSHEMKKGFDPDSRVHKSHITETCGACHGEIARVYSGSVHGAALRAGKSAAPVCTDCHGEHDILLHTDPRSPVAAANVSAQTCSPCHASLRLSEKYGIASDRFRTFEDSYHGLALKGGSVEVANCASCHGSHDILPSSDPASRIHPENLVGTCGQCHPGANARFATGTVHVAVARDGEPVLWWIASIYVWTIVLVVGGMLLHNLLDFLRKARRRLRIRREGSGEPAPAGRGLYLRMTVNERLQHGSLLVSFVVLVVTGFMLRYPEAWWVEALRRLSDDLFEIRSLLHRVAGVVMIAAGIWHMGYLAFTRRGRELIRDLVPVRKDLADALGVMRFNLGLSRRKPRFGRFGYIEKSEYWALVWGSIVMGATGVLMWFENTSMSVMTKFGYDVSRTIHFYEAWLATLAILVWHIYFVVFNPDVYPMNLAWLTGTLSEEEMEEEHPLELEAIRRARLQEALREQARKAGEQEESPPEGGPGGREAALPVPGPEKRSRT